jgi:hypothetical protein
VREAADVLLKVSLARRVGMHSRRGGPSLSQKLPSGGRRTALAIRGWVFDLPRAGSCRARRSKHRGPATGRTAGEPILPIRGDRELVHPAGCAELCGVDHAGMLFNVEVVNPVVFDQRMAELRAAGQTGSLPRGITEPDPASQRVPPGGEQ